RELGITARSCRTAGGTLVGLQSPSSARARSAGAPSSHSPSATLRPAVVLPLIALPFFPGCVTSWTAKALDVPAESWIEKRQGDTEPLLAVQAQTRRLIPTPLAP